MMNSVTRVLVVDDNIDAAVMLAESLSLWGLDVVVAHTPVAALDVVGTFVPEVALLDIGLPQMNGYELARRITASCGACRLIAVTGFGGADDRARAMAAGFAAFLVKPVNTTAILAAMGSELDRDGTVSASAMHRTR